MITGDKVIIKGVTKESAAKIYEWVNIEELRDLTGTLYPVSEYEHEEWIKAQVTSRDKKLFLVCDKESGEEIGTIGLKNCDWINRSAELFINLGQASNKIGSGYGSDAVSTLVNYCFSHLNFHRVFLRVFESNKHAIACYKKCGFISEGVLKDSHFSKGKYENTIIMSILSPT